MSNDDSLGRAMRGKLQASMRVALELLASGKADAVVSAGNTGALMALSRHLLPMLPGIDRPAIVKVLAGESGARLWMLDLGANVGCSAEQLHQFAAMGSVVAEAVGRVEQPRVALLNIGAEDRKGPAVVREAADLIGADPRLNFVGYIEASELFSGVADVAVADGFVGNIALKATEGAAKMARYLMRRELSQGFANRLGALLMGKAFARLEDAYNPQVYNGASFVGLDGVVVKSHGSADREGFYHAVRLALSELQAEVPGRVRMLHASG